MSLVSRLPPWFRRRIAGGEALVVVALVAAAVRGLPSARLLALMGHALQKPPPINPSGVLAAKCAGRAVAEAVRRASRHVPRATCLVQALSGWLLLRRRGIRSSVCLGVSQPAGGFSAHAWLEIEGEVVIGGVQSTREFTPLTRG